LLSAVFYLASALVYLEFDETRRRSSYLLALGLFVLALLSKTVTATLPAAMLVVEVLEPKTAKTGMNAIRLLVKDASGKPITGAQVDVGLFMPKMGSMAPMSSKATLTESGNGVYAGQIEFQMAWTWQTTVTVRKNGNVIGVVQTNITAR
jgi:hypothetical protein